MTSVGSWQFSPLVPQFAANILPNVGVYKASNGSWEYQIQLAWPLNWTSQADASTVDTMYVLDGNALGLTATEAFRRRRPVEFNMPDSIIVSIGYPETIADSPYSTQRSYDYQPPVCDSCAPAAVPGVASNADAFIDFIDTALRPWVQDVSFPNVRFDRDALYGHSFGGLFVLYALTVRPQLFDTFLSASPALFWNNEYVFNQPEFLAPLRDNATNISNATRPALQISYGALEQAPVRRRTETAEAFAFRQSILVPMRMTDLCQELHTQVRGSKKLRDVSIHEYPFSDHAAVGASALADGIDYFLDW